MEAYSVAHSTLGHRLHGCSSWQEAAQRRLKMTSGEEEAIEEWCLTVASWCMPLRVKMLHNMSEQLLWGALGKEWTKDFIDRYPKLQSAWSKQFDFKRAACSYNCYDRL
ncbi:hypothetical protein L873DRAFT_1785050 [Choiromyces venosus 120613-1]|uniref:HTH CENPB-type domain-containing protein n=1 Tax=Choiromyces venosus 120613-1 TaxID=1336337 RepID=A0A3N4ISE6_9PEZI|nr:hypothetical protein L873DRAFT_1785050 [Choiromyces venosus 120613-1]